MKKRHEYWRKGSFSLLSQAKVDIPQNTVCDHRDKKQQYSHYPPNWKGEHPSTPK